jgi:hypothetical protein
VEMKAFGPPSPVFKRSHGDQNDSNRTMTTLDFYCGHAKWKTCTGCSGRAVDDQLETCLLDVFLVECSN